MGAAKSTLSKAVQRVGQNWNVENRARRAIEHTDRVATPRYPTEARMIAQQKASNPVPKSAIPGLETEKNPALDDWLKKVKVYSSEAHLNHGPVEHDPRKGTTGKALPQDREPPVLDQYGYSPQARTPPGKINMKDSLELLSLYQQDPEANTPSVLAEKYNIREEDATALVNNCAVFALFVPKTEEKEAKVFDMKESFLSTPLVAKIIERSFAEFEAYTQGPNAHKLFLLQREKVGAEAVMLQEAADKGLPPPDIGPAPGTSNADLTPEKVEDRVRRPDRGRRS